MKRDAKGCNSQKPIVESIFGLDKISIHSKLIVNRNDGSETLIEDKLKRINYKSKRTRTLIRKAIEVS